MTTKSPMGEEKPVITTGIGQAKGAYRTLPMPVRYAINFALVAVFIVVGELMIDGGAINRYQ